jgi:hypothetical protein
LSFQVRSYTDADEQGWLRCRVFGFQARYSYLHVYISPTEAREQVTLSTEGLRPVLAFAHSTGENRDELRRPFERVHDDVLFERSL